MNLVSNPVQSLQGDIVVAGDKSISHRALILGSIAQGITTIHGFLDSDDCLATMDAFHAMGVPIHRSDNQTIIIHGVGKHGLQPPNKPLDCGNSGTSMRLLAGLLAAQSFDSVLTGDGSLLKRPMDRVIKPLLQMGANITGVNGRAPLLCRGGHSLKGVAFRMQQASAQVKSCLLLAGLYAKGKTTVIESTITRDHTERMLRSFSYPVHQLNGVITIDSKSVLQATNLMVPGDLSSAAFFIVAATLVPNASIYIRRVGINSTRCGVITILKAMGAHIKIINKRYETDEPVADLYIQSASLKGIDILPSMVSTAIDEFPIIFIAAACASGTTSVRGASELRFKESDRITAMVDGLKQLGITATALTDGIIIEGGVLQGGVVDSFGDHRIAMAFSIAGAVATDSITIKNCASITTSFPSFLDTARQINLSIQDLKDES